MDSSTIVADLRAINKDIGALGNLGISYRSELYCLQLRPRIACKQYRSV